jgi:hypothetical protein
VERIRRKGKKEIQEPETRIEISYDTTTNPLDEETNGFIVEEEYDLVPSITMVSGNLSPEDISIIISYSPPLN